MPVFVRGDQRVLFVHVPKTGGSSIERTFVDSGWEMHFHDRASGPGSINRLRTCTPQHMHATMLRQTFRLRAFDLIFQVVREPVARFRSECAMKLGRARGAETGAAAVEAWAAKVLDRYQNDRFALDNHLRPQHEFVLPRGEVFRFEDGLEDVYRRLTEKHGVEVTAGASPVHDRATRSGVPSSQVVISAALDEQLRSFYAEDFDRFGY